MSLDYTYWKDGDWYVGHFDAYPDYETQGKTLQELEQMLISLYKDLELDKQHTTYGKGKLALT